MSGSTAALDVSRLPSTVFGPRAPIWWGNLLFMVIESVSLSLLVVSYYYLWQGNADWPPARAEAGPPTADTLPALAIATWDTALLAASCLAMAWVHRAALRHQASVVRWGLVLIAILGAASLVLRCLEFPDLKFRWDENAYSSVVWWIMGTHLLYIMAAALEVVVLAAWIFLYGFDESKAVDVTLAAIYWYWMVGVWFPLYATVFWAPRLLGTGLGVVR